MKSPFNLTKQIPITTQSQRNPFLSPFLSLRNPFLSVQNELERAMNDFYNLSEPLSFPVEKFEDLRIYPSIDVVDNEKSFKVEVELPGMDEENIKVSINNGVLNIKGEKKASKKDKGQNYVSREISYGYYERNVPLPDSVDTEKAKASFKKGMLWVDIPKKPEAAKEGRELTIEKV